MRDAVGERDWVVVPLSHGQVLVPRNSQRSWGAGISLTSPCRSALLTAHRVLEVVARSVPLDAVARRTDAAARVVVDRSLAVLGGAGVAVDDATAVAVGIPRQTSRPHGVALVELRTGVRTFVKWSDESEAIEVEAAALAALDGGGGGYVTPRLTGHGHDGSVAWLASTALPPGRHRPHWSPDWDAVGALTRTAGPDASDGTDETTAHGDFAAWNVRRCGDEVWVIDWADCGRRPAGFDRLYFDVAASAMGRRTEIVVPSPATLRAVGALVDDRIRRRAEPLDVSMGAILDRLELC